MSLKKLSLTSIILSIGILAVLIAVVTFVVGSLLTRTSGDTAGQAITFSGTVDATSNACAYDGNCSVTVDGKIVMTGGGLSANSANNIYGSSAAVKVGDKVNVKAVKTTDGYTLQGCTSCYVKIQ